ncbi:NAD(P)H-binding protein [Spirillospora sp. NPDC047279]|uniref:NmrA family NAD(P)-binding protein n=1 Tax=Spirillospora sp. NPDC047279 TaxID=3155478 RepID=UPI0033F55203
MNPTTLVLGGTGKTGRRVARRLQERGLPVRIGSRSGEPPFDWGNPTTWGPALQGAEAVYMAYYPDVAAPGAADAVGAFAETAVASGARRLVLLSGRGEDEALAAEERVRASGADLTVVRSSWFAQNFSEDYLLDMVRWGEVALPAGDVPEPFVDVEDIADVAVAALTQDGHVGQVYEVTGPRALTFAEAVAAISDATGQRVQYIPMSVADFTAAAYRDLPGDVVEFLTYLFTTVLDGRNAHPTDGVQRVLGRPPTGFADFARRTAATGVWNGQ